MANEIAVFESQLKPLLPQLAKVLADRMPVERLAQTMLISCERNPRLLDCDRQSLFNAAMSAAVLGLEVDGVTGQAFLIPYGRRAQLVVGYKGYTTMGARSGYTITGACVREGDEFDYMLGSTSYLKHKPTFRADARITHAWAVATNLRLPPIISVLSIHDIIAVKNKSPGAKKDDSPWNDKDIGFPAMSEKTAKRRLARSMPLNVMQYAARMEEAWEEQGRPAWIHPERGPQIEPPLVQASGDIEANDRPAEEPPPSQGIVTPPSDGGGLSLLDRARAEARKGEAAFVAWYRTITPSEKQTVQGASGELRDLMNEHDLGPAG